MTEPSSFVSAPLPVSGDQLLVDALPPPVAEVPESVAGFVLLVAELLPLTGLETKFPLLSTSSMRVPSLARV